MPEIRMQSWQSSCLTHSQVHTGVKKIKLLQFSHYTHYVFQCDPNQHTRNKVSSKKCVSKVMCNLF